MSSDEARLLHELNQKVDRLVSFTDALTEVITGLATAPGIQGMMVRNALPSGLLESLQKVG